MSNRFNNLDDNAMAALLEWTPEDGYSTEEEVVTDETQSHGELVTTSVDPWKVLELNRPKGNFTPDFKE